ncbi:MAG TPA: nickel pincer cofactor biosynthesis protein LarB, partial [Planctomycetaceae bacterium]|nr:nickel pincer cofactor biosynthesis protein LarB [Planctomycetaceae bacterium]
MNHNDLPALLEQWRSGQLTVADFDAAMREHYATTAVVDGALIDLDRVRRCGFPEVVYGAGKSPDQVLQIFMAQEQAGQASLVTRATNEQADVITSRFPDAVHNAVARTIRRGLAQPSGSSGRIAVLTAGSTDRPVAEEAVETARWMGCDVRLITDVGVAGPQRLIDRRHEFADMDAVVVVAGMEGALPSVVGGWIDCPVVGVPTSVGYGAQLQGLAPLLSMLNSCAANVCVVNIDSGFKGGYFAGLIARRRVSS